ncbi:hypothetical protein MW887_008862 [Aspergillus wentii]|nr:hypothetical protein MW887_008862 [Aspergillus wentii]
MHFKPIPRYLLNYNFWKDHLCCSEGLSREQNVCPRRELYKCAMGFLLSYAALIQYESDFQIAQHRHLLPTEISWEIWVKFIEQVLARKDFKNINRRYRFGELRLSRLNKIYAIRLGYILRGYRFPYQTYTELFQDYLAPIAAATVYIAVVLTAMQVGLATENLSRNKSFQNASYGFTVFSILAPLILLSLVAFIWFLELVSNIYVTWKFKKKRFRQLELMDGG